MSANITNKEIEKMDNYRWIKNKKKIIKILFKKDAEIKELNADIAQNNRDLDKINRENEKLKSKLKEKEKEIVRKVRGNIMRLLISQPCNTIYTARVQTKIINYLDKLSIEELLK